MKILYTADLHYFPALGGANKINRRVLEGLAARGHVVRAVMPALGTPSRITLDQLRAELASLGIAVRAQGDVDVFTLDGVEVHAVTDPSSLRRHLVEQIASFAPDCVVATSEDPTQKLLDAALRACPDRVVYLVNTAAFLPFGPQSFFPGPRRAQLLSRARAIGAISGYVARYIAEFGGGLKAEVVNMPIFDRGPFPALGRFDAGYVTLVNPCAVKGLPLFLQLARALPDVKFAAVPTWGTTDADRALLAAAPNVTCLPASEDIDRIFRQTRVLVMPSLWAESFGMTCIEAMLRGIPVLASDIGGLPEAKLGTDYLLPVRPIDGYASRLDGNMIPIGACPEQDVGPWVAALGRLLGDRAEYERQSAAARVAAHGYFESPIAERLEAFLLRAVGRA